MSTLRSFRDGMYCLKMFLFQIAAKSEMYLKFLIWVLVVFAPLSTGQTSTVITTSSSENPSLFGREVILSTSITPIQATGKVTFYDGATILGTATVVNGNATLKTSLLASGTRFLGSRFIGNAVYGASNSQRLSQTVSVVSANTLQAPITYPTANTVTQHAAVADFNGDGHLDIVTNNYTVLMGNGDGTFRPPTIYSANSNSYGVVTGDFNGDGKPDFATAGLDGNVGVWINDGAGKFKQPLLYPTGGSPRSLVTGDFNGDGIADIAVALLQGQASGIGVLIGVGDGSFQPFVTYLLGTHQTALAVADFNGDGKSDIAAASTDDRVVTILLGKGDGTFLTMGIYPSVNAQNVSVGDFNKDGKPDFVVANSGSILISVFLGNGDGTFGVPSSLPITLGTGGPQKGLAVGDFDGDGNPDLAWAGSNPTISIFLGKGDGTFRGAVNFPAGSNAGSLIAAAFNGDGRTDLAVTNPSSLQILLAGTGIFPTVESTTVPDSMGGVPYSTLLGAIGGTAPYTWSLSAGGFPRSMSLSSEGAIAGTPPKDVFPGIYSFTAMAAGASGAGFLSSQNLSLKIAATFLVQWDGGVGAVGVPYLGTGLFAIGGMSPYRDWTVVAGSLPPGLRLDSTTGHFQGVPTATGQFSFTASVTDSIGVTSSPTAFTMTIVPNLVISTPSLPSAVVGVPYRVALTGSGGTPPYKNWQIGLGALPTGLTLDAVSGVISGTPTSFAGNPYVFFISFGQAGQSSEPKAFIIFVSDGLPGPKLAGIFNAASGSQSYGLTTAIEVSPGSYVAIYGTGLAGSGNSLAMSLPLPTTLNGTKVTVGGIPMPLVYAAAGQVNGMVPQALTANNTYPLVVTSGSTQSSPVMLFVREVQPGIYTTDSSGIGSGVVANALTGQLITAKNPAKAGDYLVVYCTGLGQLQGQNGKLQPLDGSIAPLDTIFQTTATIKATIGGFDALVLFSGLTPAFAGLYQINVQVPDGVSPGSDVPLLVSTLSQTGSAALSNLVTIAVK